MRTILRGLLLWIVATSGQLHAQRCGYDYLQAFVIKVVQDGDTQQVEKLTLHLIGGGGVPISYSQEWANEVGRVTGKKEVDRFFNPKLKEKYYVLFFDSRSYDPRKPPVWYVKVELTGNNSRLPKNFSIFFNVSPSEGNYLCGHTGPYKIRTLNLSDTVEVRIPPSFSEKPTPVNVDARKKGKEDFPQKKAVEVPKRPQYPSVFIKQKQVQWVEMKGKEYLFKDSLRIYNRGAEAVKLPKLEWTKPQYEAQYYTVSFNLKDAVRAKKIMRNWVGKGWIESAHQGLVLASGAGEGITYLSGEITLKPVNYQWIPEYKKIADTAGFKLAHSFGDGTVMLSNSDRFIDAEVFFKQRKFSDDTRWKYGNPGFFTPIRIEVDDLR